MIKLTLQLGKVKITLAVEAMVIVAVVMMLL